MTTLSACVYVPKTWMNILSAKQYVKTVTKIGVTLNDYRNFQRDYRA